MLGMSLDPRGLFFCAHCCFALDSKRRYLDHIRYHRIYEHLYESDYDDEEREE